MAWQETLHNLEEGKVRAAYQENGEWKANLQVKKDILETFKAGDLVLMNDGYVDKHNLEPRSIDTHHQIRFVPTGSTIRRGAYVSKNVIIMPPSYINIGAYIDEGTLVDSHVLVGSCAQIGKNVHLSAGVKLGGVLEPIGMNPVIIEDNAFIGAGAIIVEGVQISKNAVIAPGVVLSKSVPVYDTVNQIMLEPGSPIPQNAIVVPGTRKLKHIDKFTEQHNLQLNCAIIIKYRDDKSDAALELESALR